MAQAAKKPSPKNDSRAVSKAADKGVPSTDVLSFERDAGAGLEGADQDCYAQPFLTLLQKMSPQVDRDSDKYIKGASAGDFLNGATGEVYDGKKGVVLVPVHFERKYVEWGQRDDGGGFKGSYRPDEINLADLERDDSGRFQKGDNYLADTRYHYCIQLTPDGRRNIVLSLTSTQIKKSRNWVTAMSMIRFEGKNGKPFCPPTFAHAWRITTVAESNDKGSWHGVKIEKERVLGKGDEAVVAEARALQALARGGRIRVDEATDTQEVVHADKF